jgi:hypothetical protein
VGADIDHVAEALEVAPAGRAPFKRLVSEAQYEGSTVSEDEWFLPIRGSGEFWDLVDDLWERQSDVSDEDHAIETQTEDGLIKMRSSSLIATWMPLVAEPRREGDEWRWLNRIAEDRGERSGDFFGYYRVSEDGRDKSVEGDPRIGALRARQDVLRVGPRTAENAPDCVARSGSGCRQTDEQLSIGRREPPLPRGTSLASCCFGFLRGGSGHGSLLGHQRAAGAQRSSTR